VNDLLSGIGVVAEQTLFQTTATGPGFEKGNLQK